MKKIVFFILLFISLKLSAQWQWAHSAGGNNSWDYGNSIANDTAGNAYVIGSFQSTTMSVGAINLTNAGVSTEDIFLLKYSSSGTPMWAVRAGGANQDYGRAVTADAFGNIYITGHYYSDTLVFGNDTLFNTGVTDIYTVKFSINGNPLWARNGGGSSFDESNTITTDAAGNVYVAGQFVSDSISFGTHTVYNTNADTLDMFLVKYDAAGNVLWARSAGGIGNDAILGIATDQAGNVVITGSSGSPVCTFGSVTLNSTGILGYSDVFTVKYDSTGNVLWGKSGKGVGFEQGTGVAVDTSNNIYVAGSFASTNIVFDNDTLFNARTSGGPSDIFLVKYNSAGTLLWARCAGTRHIDDASGVSLDNAGNACITGTFSDTVMTIGSFLLPNSGAKDIFVIKYNSSGNVESAFAAGDSGDDKSYAISTFNSSQYLTGEFSSANISFGTAALHNAGGGYTDVFIAKVAMPTALNELNMNDEVLNIYPNPSSGKFRIENSEIKIAEIKITNLLGQLVFESQITNHKSPFYIDISGEAKGIYFIQLTTENNIIINKKIIIN